MFYDGGALKRTRQINTGRKRKLRLWHVQRYVPHRAPGGISNTFIVGQAERNRIAQTTILTSMYNISTQTLPKHILGV